MVILPIYRQKENKTMAKNSYKANVNQYANQEEAIRKAKGISSVSLSL